MSKYYELAGPEVMATVKKVMDEVREDLHDAGVTVQAIMIDAGSDEEGNRKPAITKEGWPVAAKIKITSLRDRVLGQADAVMDIDKPYWMDLLPAEREALVDHELAHLELEKDEDGEVRLDASERPVLKTRRHDWHLTGFAEVVERRGEAALEFKGLAAFMEKKPAQMVMDFVQTDGKAKRSAA